MAASSKRREQQSALQRSGAVGRKRSRDIRNYEVASDSDGTDDDDDYYDDDGEEGEEEERETDERVCDAPATP